MLARRPARAWATRRACSVGLMAMRIWLALLLPIATTSLLLRLGGPCPVRASGHCPRCASIASEAADPSADDPDDAEAAALMRQFQELQAKQAAQRAGGTRAAEGSVEVGALSARWRECSTEVSLWIPVSGELRARDVCIVFGSRSLSVEVAGEVLLTGAALHGKIEPDASWWAFDDADVELDVVLDGVEAGGKALQIALVKGDNAVWAGVFDDDG